MKQLLSSTKAMKILTSDLARGALSHAYLLVFPDAKILRAVLKELAKVILGEDERIHSLVEKESYADLKIYPEEEGKRLNVDAVNSLLDDSLLLPVEGKKKIFILDKFQDANASVQNKLLKILEEPPAGEVFLLGTTSEFAVLPTVRSRVRILREEPFSPEQILSYLTRHYPKQENLGDYAASAGGLLSEAIALVEGGYYGEMLSLCEQVVWLKEEELPFLATKILAFSHREEFLSLLALVFRDILMYNIGGTPLLKGISLKESASLFSPAACVAIEEEIQTAERDLRFNASYPQLVENLLMKVITEKKNAENRRR